MDFSNTSSFHAFPAPVVNTAFLTGLQGRLREGKNDIVAGTIAGMTATCIEFPADTLKTRLQTSNKTALQCFREVVNEKGIRGLYKGVSAPLMGAMMENAIMFASFNESKRFFSSHPEEQLGVGKIALAASFSGLAVSFWLTPMELVKVRLQAAHTTSAYTGTFDCIQQTFRTQGVRGFYRGLGATMAREVPGMTAYFVAYEMLCRAFTPVGKTRQDLSSATFMAAGSLSGMAYWISLFPVDLIKAKIQTDMSGERTSFLGCLRSVIRTEGVRGLYRGLGVTLARAAPANACIFSCYEYVSRLLNQHNKD